MSPTPNKYAKRNRVEYYNIKGTIKRTERSVVMEIDTGGVILELHFADPAQLMNYFVLMIEQMAEVFPDFEASKLWKDDGFK